MSQNFIRVEGEPGTDLILNTDHIISVNREAAKVTVRTSDSFTFQLLFTDNGEAQECIEQVARELEIHK